jgi:hypothetical protein
VNVRFFRFGLVLAAVSVVVSAMAGSGWGRSVLSIRVRGTSTSAPSSACFIRIRQRVVGGGTLTYCLKTFHGQPGPNATVRDSGEMTFALSGGTIQASVQIAQRFGRDGKDAVQSLKGTLTTGSGRFRRAEGTISGGGSDVENPPGHIAAAHIRYTIVLR